MVAADTSSLIAYLQGSTSPDSEAVNDAVHNDKLVLPPVVVTELLSSPKTGAAAMELLDGVPMLELTEGYWLRAGRTRGLLLGKGLKARLGDALVAQACIDHNVPLIARDVDFRHFAKHCGLKLAV